MEAAAQRVEGYLIVTEYLGKKGSIGNNGKEALSPAFSKEAAEAYLASIKHINVTHAFQIIRGAQFVVLPTGEVVDNGKSSARMYT